MKNSIKTLIVCAILMSPGCLAYNLVWHPGVVAVLNFWGGMAYAHYVWRNKND